MILMPMVRCAMSCDIAAGVSSTPFACFLLLRNVVDLNLPHQRGCPDCDRMVHRYRLPMRIIAVLCDYLDKKSITIQLHI